MEAIMKSDGSKFQNLFIKNGNIHSLNQHEINGILISYSKSTDVDGNPCLRPHVSTLCVDDELSDKLSEAARELLRHVQFIKD